MKTMEVEIPQSARAFSARGAALHLWKSRNEEILIDGPAGTGKTRAILEKIHYCAMRYPRMRALLVRKTRESLTESVLVTFEEKVVPANSEILEGPRRNLRQSYEYPNGSSIVIGGMDKASKVMSTEYDVVGCFESTELSQEDYENLTTRLRNGIMPYQQILVDCNPGPPNHWLKKRADAGKMLRMISRHEDNPVLFQNGHLTLSGERYLAKLDRLSGARYQRLRKGMWSAAEGMVYESYQEDKHTVNRFEPPRFWPRIRAFDFGYKNPFVCQWWAFDPDDRAYLYREIYHTKRLVEDHARQILKLSEGERYEANVSDHDAEDRATLEKHLGCTTLPAFKSITPGIEAIQMRLRIQPDDKPRVFFMRDAIVEVDEELREAGLPLCTYQEMDNYIWPKDLEGKSLKEEPVDKDNHGMDAMRYAIAFRDDAQSMTLQVTMDEASVIEAQ